MKNFLLVTLASGLMLISSAAQSQEPECKTVADCAQKAMEASYQAKLALEIGTPKGAVMAFNLKECPKGWKLFAPAAGRVIVGSGTGLGLTPREVGQQGGEEQHTLTVAEMPKHSHSYASETGIDGNRSGWQDATYNRTITQTSEAGEGLPHNNMPPFLALLYCERN